MMCESWNKSRSNVDKEVRYNKDKGIGKQSGESPKKAHQRKESAIPNPVQEVSMDDE